MTTSFWVMAGAALFLWSATSMTHTLQQQQHARSVYADSRTVLIDLLNAETGQRGFVVTGDERYLQPYEEGTAAVRDDLDRLAKNAAPDEAPAVEHVRELVGLKLDEMDHTIQLRQTAGLPAATQAVADNQGKVWMDATRSMLGDIIDREEARREAATAAMLRTLELNRAALFVVVVLSVVRAVFQLRRRFRLSTRATEAAATGPVASNTQRTP